MLTGVCQLTNKVIIQEHIAPSLAAAAVDNNATTSAAVRAFAHTADDAHSSRALPPWCDPSSAVLSKETQAIKATCYRVCALCQRVLFPEGYGSKSRLPSHRDVLSALVNELGGLPLPVCAE